MSTGEGRVCFSWINKGKCKYGSKCRYLHYAPKRQNFGICLDFACGIERCKGPEFCVFEHKIGNLYNANPCSQYTAGYCGFGWTCQKKHCALQAAAKLSDEGKHPPKFMQEQIAEADRLWSDTFTDRPINTLKFISVIQRFFLTLIPDKRTTRGLAEIVTEYSLIFDMPLDLHYDPYREREHFADTKKYIDTGCNLPGYYTCSFCFCQRAQKAILSIKTNGIALLCGACAYFAHVDDPKDRLEWYSAIPSICKPETSLEIFGFSKKGTVIYLPEQPKIGDYILHGLNKCILVMDCSQILRLRIFRGLCPECRTKK